jgi:hypothetical protein
MRKTVNFIVTQTITLEGVDYLNIDQRSPGDLDALLR